MTHLVDELAAGADAAIAAMQAAARAARVAHARAELMRHMMGAARRRAGAPRAEAVADTVREWTDAWGLAGARDLAAGGEMEAFAAAVHDYADRPGAAQDAALRSAVAALEAAFAARGTSLADEMAWRSQCAHGWWEAVSPTPAALPGARPRPDIPRPRDGEAFWTAGCAPFCREAPQR